MEIKRTYISEGLLGTKIRFFECLLWLLVFFLYLHSTISFAQLRINQIEHLSVDEQLSSRQINKILEGPEGFIWLATDNGLNKYDGYQIRVYKEGAQFNQTSERHISDLHLDQYGQILLQYAFDNQLVDRLDPITDRIQSLHLTLQGDSVRFQSIYVNRQKEVWALMERSSELVWAQMNQKGHFKAVFSLPKASGAKASSYQFLLEGQQGGWLFDDQIGLREILPNRQWGRIFPFSHFGKIAASKLQILHLDRKGQLYVAFQGHPGLYIYDAKTQGFQLYKALPVDLIYDALWEDERGWKLVAIRKNSYELEGLLAVDTADQLIDYSALLEVDEKITNIMERGFSSLLFLGTLSGMKKVRLQGSKVQQILAQDIDPKKGEWGFVMHGIAEDRQGDILMAREVERWYRYKKSTQTIEAIPLKDPSNQLPREFQCSFDLFIDEQEVLWGSTCDQGGPFYLHAYDLKTKQLKSFPSERLIYGFVKSVDGDFWLNSRTSEEPIQAYLMRFDPKEERFYVYTNKDGTNPLANAYPRFIYESREGILWIGDRKGLIRVDRASGTSEWMRSQNTWLEGSEVMAITELADGRLALGSSNGLLLFAPSTQSLKQYTQKQGLCNNNVCGLLTDEQGNLWLSTFNGLAYFDLENEIFYNFDDKDGFSHHEFNRFSLFRAKDGRIYAGGMNGVNAFYPKQLLDIPPPPPIRLTAFQKYNSSQDSLYLQQTHLQQLDRVVIHPDDTYFQFNFSLPDFTDTKKNQYQSWLKGYEKSWTYLGTNPLVRYSNLPAGQYELLIRGANSKGNWNEEPLKIHIEVQQVFYKTMGFYVCCMLLLSLLGYWLYRNRLNQLLHVERLRTKIASDLHDEIGSIMTRISIGTELLKEGVVSEEDQQKELEHISQQSRQVTSIMSDVIWSIDARKDRLQDLIDRMREHLEELLGAAGITYQLDILALPLQKKLEVDVRQNLYFIFKESINNIVKHSNAQNVQVLIDNSQSELHLSIKDDGTISKQHPKKGQGLKNMALRAQRIGAQLNIRNEEGFEVELKIGGI